jgi:hypothetical protein
VRQRPSYVARVDRAILGPIGVDGRRIDALGGDLRALEDAPDRPSRRVPEAVRPATVELALELDHATERFEVLEVASGWRVIGN